VVAVVRCVVAVTRRMIVVVVAAVGSVVVASPVVDGIVVEGMVDRTTAECAMLSAYPTKSADVAHEPKKIAWVTCRTRAKRRSRCWGVR
jgi:hypothetical protein